MVDSAKDMRQAHKASGFEWHEFSRPAGLATPVIVLFDNDSGGKSVGSSAEEAGPSGKAVNVKDAFTHIVKNLYLVPTPVPSGQQESKIEGFFAADIKKTILSGKTFSTDNDYDKTKFYGKSEFADQVVVPHAKTIDFKGFAPLLPRSPW
jgi:RNA-directed DNA polymerase